MVQEVAMRLSPRDASNEDFYLSIVAAELRIHAEDISAIEVMRKSIDARQKRVIVDVKFKVYTGNDKPEARFNPIVYPDVSAAAQVVIVGAGPAGLFAALRCVELGLRPVIIERGKNVHDRKRDIAQITRRHVVDPDSNWGFGEGGAGTFSDGKLYTRSIKRGNVPKILEILVQHGASTEILVDAHPHIGTDKLPGVITNIRKTIENCGGAVHFSTCVTKILTTGNKVTGVETRDGQQFAGPVILATGHSARDVYRMLKAQGITLEAKSFAMGVRIEHPQTLIDNIQYHTDKGRGPYLPAAAYALTSQVDGRGVYSFCMCPGGFIVPAATAAEELVVNGMSPSGRNSQWANSGIVVEVRDEDLKPYAEMGELAGMAFQQHIEKLAWEQGGKTQTAPAQRMVDFVNNHHSAKLPATSYTPGIVSSDIHTWLPQAIAARLKKGFIQFGQRNKGYLTNEAVLLGVESRTSSPVRIPRDRETYQHIAFEGLFPCGEGAGYAGGIVSSAIDGENCADAVKKWI